MATRSHALHCFDVLSAHLQGQTVPKYAGDDDTQEYPLFVTWNTLRPNGSTRLRGCIGSFSPLPLKTGLGDYALTAAIKDRRFSPISLSELPKLECGVSLLTDFEDVQDSFDWEVGVHGIYIHFSDPERPSSSRTLSATYLPDVAPEQGWDKIDALDSAMRKAGYNGHITDEIRQSVRVTRYQSSKITVSYEEWQREKGT